MYAPNYALRWNELRLWLKRTKPAGYEAILKVMVLLNDKESYAIYYVLMLPALFNMESCNGSKGKYWNAHLMDTKGIMRRKQIIIVFMEIITYSNIGD